MKTLKEYAESKGAKLYPTDLCDQIILDTAPAKGMFFSGDVIEHLSVKDPKGGLNKRGYWPFYLIDDGKELKILRAC